MLAYRKERIENTICYLASKHLKQKGEPLYQTFLYKYLAFLEFDSLESIGKPLYEFTYKAMKNGPVPLDIYSKRYNYETDLFIFIPLEDNKIIVIPKKEPDTDYLSEHEIQKIDELLKIFAQPGIKSKIICKASHKIKAWKKAWQRKKNSLIRYQDSFSENLDEKKETALSHQENSYLVYRGLRKLSRNCG